MYELDCRHNGPSAAELLEASKKLYVKTEFLKRNRVDPNAPRMFKTPSEEELDQLYQNSRSTSPRPTTFVSISPPRLKDKTNNAVTFCLTSLYPHSSLPRSRQRFEQSTNSAFQPIGSKPPPRPPKSDEVRKRANALALGLAEYSLPSYNEFRATVEQHQYLHQQHHRATIPEQDENQQHRRVLTRVVPPPVVSQPKQTPQPAPRLSLLKHNSNTLNRPVAPPRRRMTTTFIGELLDSTYIGDPPSSACSSSIQHHSRATSTTNLMVKSSPDLSLELSILPTPSATPSTQIDSSYVSNTTSGSFNASMHSYGSPDSAVSSLRQNPQCARMGAEARSLRHTTSLKNENELIINAKPPRAPMDPAKVRRSHSSHTPRQNSGGTSSLSSPTTSKDSGIPCSDDSVFLSRITPQIQRQDSEFEESVKRWERRRTLANLRCGTLSRPSNLEKTTFDSENKQECEDGQQRPKSVHEMFDSQGLDPQTLEAELQRSKAATAPMSPSAASAGSDLASDFTSITAERPPPMNNRIQDDRDVTPQPNSPTPAQFQLQNRSTSLPTPVEKPVSILEKNARVLRWIHGCSMATSC